MKQPQVVGEFIALVGQASPWVTIKVDRADAPDGNWWFDARVNGELLTVFWSPKFGFGFSTQNEVGFGEKPNEIYVSAEMAALRFAQLVKRAGSGRTMALGISDLRELCGLSQTELAKRVGVEQAAVSRAEGRDNIELKTLSSLVEAMGFRIDVRVTAPGVTASIEPGRGKKKAISKTRLHRQTRETELALRLLKPGKGKKFYFKNATLAKPEPKSRPLASKTRRVHTAAPGKSQGLTK